VDKPRRRGGKEKRDNEEKKTEFVQHKEEKKSHETGEDG